MTMYNQPPEIPDEPETLSPLRLQELHTTYLRAIALNDAEDICWVGNQFYQQEGYLLEDVVDDARTLSKKLFVNPMQPYGHDINDILGTAIRAYEYSGVAIHAPLVKTVTQLCGLDRFWLRDMVAPSPYVLHEVLNATSRIERKILKSRGHAALGALGLKGIQYRSKWE